MPKFTAASIDSGNLAVANSFTRLSASSSGYCLPGVSLAFQAFSRLVTAAMSEALHVNAHAARAAGDGAHRGIESGGGEVRLLSLRDLFELRAGDLANLGCIGSAAAFFNADGLADQHGRR